jgi:hypothetical protein
MNSPIINFGFICSNISAAPAYGVYIFQNTITTGITSEAGTYYSSEQVGWKDWKAR